MIRGSRRCAALTFLSTLAVTVLGPAISGQVAARAADPPAGDVTGKSEERVPTDDPTGGAYTSPTLLFIPAGAVPVWNVRVTLSSEFQSPYDTADAPSPDSGIRPGLGVELGLPLGITIGAGTNWVGGDVNTAGHKDFNLGLSPFFQARLHIWGDSSGKGFQLGTSATYKFVGFEGDPGEIELAVSGQYRADRFEAGLQAVIGKDFATTDADAEAHAYALVRVIPQLGLGVAGQVRDGVVIQPGETAYDVVGGAIASLTLGRYQVGGLFGASTIGLNQGQFGALGQIFASARF
jgi:hypothetical protein